MLEPKFKILLLNEALQYLEELDEKTRNKIIYNIDKASKKNDPELLKKLRDDIWEFRTNFSGMQYRLLAFWDKSNSQFALVVGTHGIIKKTDKVPEKEINKAIVIRKQYFLLKTNGK